MSNSITFKIMTENKNFSYQTKEEILASKSGFYLRNDNPIVDENDFIFK